MASEAVPPPPLPHCPWPSDLWSRPLNETYLTLPTHRSDPLRDWEGVSARFAALPAEGGRPPTPRRLHPAPDTASQDGEESLDAVDLDARAPSARSVTPRAQGEEGEGATASQGYGEAGEIVPAPHAVTEAGSRDPGSLVALVAHSRHISTTSLESASASGDDRQAGDAGVGVASAHFRRRSAVDTSAAGELRCALAWVG